MVAPRETQNLCVCPTSSENECIELWRWLVWWLVFIGRYGLWRLYVCIYRHCTKGEQDAAEPDANAPGTVRATTHQRREQAASDMKRRWMPAWLENLLGALTPKSTTSGVAVERKLSQSSTRSPTRVNRLSVQTDTSEASVESSVSQARASEPAADSQRRTLRAPECLATPPECVAMPPECLGMPPECFGISIVSAIRAMPQVAINFVEAMNRFLTQRERGKGVAHRAMRYYSEDQPRALGGAVVWVLLFAFYMCARAAKLVAFLMATVIGCHRRTLHDCWLSPMAL